MSQMYDAYVTAALFCGPHALFALGDGTVRLEGSQNLNIHEGAVLCAAVHPSGNGIITGGDDGKLVWTQVTDGCPSATPLFEIKGRWIDSLATSPASGLIAFASGKDLHVLDSKENSFHRRFAHERSVAGVAFDAKGRRLACATYNGAALWYAKIAEQKPQILKWAGSHTGIAFSPDGKFVVTAMQENQLHGWRLADSKDMRMGGYPAKIKSLAFLGKGMVLATSGANGAIVWPFVGSGGPMGKEAAEIAYDETSLVARIAAAPDHSVLAAGLEDGRIWVCDLRSQKTVTLKAEKGAAITALDVSPSADKIAWGDEDGQAGTFAVPQIYP
jgi:WD40 repeat protein